MARTRRRRLCGNPLQMFVLAGCFAVLLHAVAAPAAVAPQGQIEGEVLQAFPTMLVIKDDRGQATVLQLTPRTQLGGVFKPGDKVVAYVTLYGVTSVQLKSATASIP